MAKKKAEVALAGNPLSNGIELPEKQLVTERFETMLKGEFPTFDATISKLAQMEVTNDVTLDQATLALKEVKVLEKQIKLFHDNQKAPFKMICDVIDASTKLHYQSVLDQESLKLNAKITTYKNLKLRQAEANAKKAEEEAKLLEKDLEDDEKIVNRRAKMATAFVFGGSFTRTNGEVKTYRMVSTAEEARKWMATILEKFPTGGTSENGKIMSRAIRDLGVATLKKMEPVLKEEVDVAKRIAYIKEGFDEELEIILHRMELKNQKLVEQDVNKAVRNVAAAAKGIQKKISWTVTDISKIPVQFLTLDEAKVREYTQKENREHVLKMIKENKEDDIIPGLHFLVTTSVK